MPVRALNAVRDDGGATRAKYVVVNYGPKTIVEAIVSAAVDPDGEASVTLDFGKCTAPSLDEALDRLGEWCARVGRELRERGLAGRTLPLEWQRDAAAPTGDAG